QNPNLSLASGSLEHSRQVARPDGKLPDANAKRRKRILNRRSDSGGGRPHAPPPPSFCAPRGVPPPRRTADPPHFGHVRSRYHQVIGERCGQRLPFLIVGHPLV